MPDERNLYRAQRRAFIAACETAHVDAIARVQPGAGTDGRPLFTDTAALGERLASRAALAVGNNARATETLIGLLGSAPQPGSRLVVVHALDPGRFGEKSDPGWAATILAAVAREDLSRVTHLTLTDLTGGDLGSILRRILPDVAVTAD